MMFRALNKLRVDVMSTGMMNIILNTYFLLERHVFFVVLHERCFVSRCVLETVEMKVALDVVAGVRGKEDEEKANSPSRKV
jgi:hypothetical protein